MMMMRAFGAFCLLAAMLCSVNVEAASGRTMLQQINFQGAGCGDVPPGKPANLRAIPKNGRVTLKWDKPNNGGCVDVYQITVFPVGGGARSLGAGTPLSTSDYEYTVRNLQNGQKYEFIVTSIANKYANQAKSASVQATPKRPNPPPVARLCTTYIRPSGPANLRVKSKSYDSVELCWDPPRNGGCVDSYDLLVEEIQPAARTLTLPSPIRIQVTKCYKVNNLRADTRYKATVSSYSNSYNGGGKSSIEFRTNK